MSITQEQLKKKVYYREDGVLCWRGDFSSRARKNEPAGCLIGSGYVLLRINKVLYKAHRLVWLYHNGYFPENQIDHIDRERANNRIENLREVSQICNSRNMKTRGSNTSGIKGLYWEESTQKWIVQAKVKYKHIHLGCFQDYDEAVCHRYAFEQCVGWHGCEVDSPTKKYIDSLVRGQI